MSFPWSHCNFLKEGMSATEGSIPKGQAGRNGERKELSSGNVRLP
jgi:hypothetical protein